MMDQSVVGRDGAGRNEIPWGKGPMERTEVQIDIRRLDVTVHVTQETRGELPPVSEDTRNELKDNGWPESLVDDLGSEAEANIYKGAGLEAKEVNGKPALVRTDIDLEKQDIFGATNLERMTAGLPPLDQNGRPIELHHIGQRQDSSLAELTKAEHCGSGNDNVLHNKRQESTINRDGFAKERAEHWKARAADFKAGE
ncbi:HNH/ENDO VII family nuclease [Stenotrophomonas sp. PUT21]|uniref:HNH/ENDO VII family nuclease n=1 Tax=Stenotrophomonas TaxID=40323 RepID=UPI003B75E211